MPENEAGPSAAVTVAKAGGIMVGALFLSRLLGMVRDTVMVAQFGIGLQTDAYRLAVLIPDMIFMLVAGGGLSSAFIPVFAEYWHRDRRDDAWKVFGVVVTVTALVTTVLVAIAWVFAPQIVDYFRDNKPVEVMPDAISMSRIMLPAQVAFLVGSVLIATLYVRKQFLGPSLAPNVYNVGIIAGAAILPGLAGMGIESMAWGALIGAIVGNVLLPIALMARASSQFRPSLDVRHEGVRKFFALLLPVILGFSLPSMVNIVTQKFASSYGADGVNTVLAAANNLMQAPLGVFGQSLALAAFPVLAEFAATRQMDRYRDQVSRTLRTVLYLGVPSGALMFALAPQIVHVLYGYGEATRSPEQLKGIVDSLRVYAFGIFAWCLQPVLMRGFFSLHKTFKPVAIGTVMTGVFIGLCVVAVKVWPTDYQMLPWAANVAATLLAIVLFVALEADVGKLDRSGLFKTLGGSLIAGLVAAGGAYGLIGLWNPQRKAAEFAALAIVGLVSMWLYYAVTLWLKMPETQYLSRAMKRLDRRRQPPTA